MTTPGAGRRLAQASLRDERGTAFLMGLTIVMVMTMLGVALFEMSTIEAGLARSDALDIQAFYCAEAEAARVYALYAPANDPNAERPSQKFDDTPVALASGTYVSRASADVHGVGVVTVTATCRLPSGRTRTVQRNGTRAYPNPILKFAHVAAGGDPQSVFGDMGLGGVDSITGDIYVSGNVHLREGGMVTGYGGPAITVAPGKVVTSTNPLFDANAVGAVGQGQVTPLPVLSNAEGSGIIDQIRSKVTNADGTPKMTGRYQDAIVYNLSEIFAQLGATNEGNRERNLARPSGCTFGSVSEDVKCQVWQDLVILGPRETCRSTPCGPGPTDRPSYFFMGLPRSPSVAPQGTPFSAIYAEAVKSSHELDQLLFTTQYASLGTRLDAILGGPPNAREDRPARRLHRGDGSGDGQGHGAPAVDLLRGRVLAHGRVGLGGRLQWPRDDRRQQVRDPLGQPALSGEHVQCECRRAERGLCRSERSRALWRGGHARDHRAGEHLDRRSEGADPRGGRRDARRTRHQSRAVRLRRHLLRGGEQFADVQRRRAGAPRHGSGSGLGRPDPGTPVRGLHCGAAAVPPRHVRLARPDLRGTDGGCWRFLKTDPATGLFTVDTTLPGFQGCVATPGQPLTPSSCPQGRRVTHFQQLTINYDKRLQDHPELIPPGLPTGGRTGYNSLAALLWKDCGSNPKCP